MSSRKRGASKGKGKKSKGSGKNKNLGQKLTSGATTAEDNSTLAGIDSAYGITLDDLRLKADTLLLDLREDLKESPVLAFTEEIEADLRALYSAATDSSQHSVDASEEMLDFSFKSQLDLTAFVDKVSNFITKTPDVDPKKYYRPLLQLYEAAYRSGLQRMNLTTKRAELIGAKERPHLHAALMDELAFLKVSNATLFEKFTTQRLVWLMQSGRWSDLPARSIMENNRALKRSNFKEPHFGALTAAVKKGDYPNCLQLLESGEGFVNEQGAASCIRLPTACVVAFLLDLGYILAYTLLADGKSGATPIHHATWDGRLDIVKLLLEYDAEVDHQTRRGYDLTHQRCLEPFVRPVTTCSVC